MNRIVQPELLDELSPDDPRARWSRRDLRRINAWMRNHAIMARALRNHLNLNDRSGGRRTAAPLSEVGTPGSLPRAATPALHITDLGAGDGHFLLRVARVISGNGAPASDPAQYDSMETRRAGGRRSAIWRDVKAKLLDRQINITAQTLSAFEPLGWRAEAVATDVFDWAKNRERQLPAGELTGEKSASRQDAGAPDVVVANLFLHHFEDAKLEELFRAVASQARLFVAIEPRRARWPLFCSRLIWAIGCNSVTRYDAAVSVRAGFSGGELSALWPTGPGWELTERRTGFFSHLFVARRRA